MSAPILLLDISNLAHRFGHAHTSLSFNGKSTGAIYGVLNEIFRLAARFEPGMIIACFDKGHAFRTSIFSEYKNDRVRSPQYDAILDQIHIMETCFRCLPIKLISKAGEESDDLIGHYCNVPWLKGKKIIISNDKDLMQLINDRIYVFSSYHGLLTPENFKGVYGCHPHQWLDARAMMGKDNINGVKGIGEVYAAKIIEQFGSIDAAIAAKLTEPKKMVTLLNRLRESTSLIDRNKQLLRIRDVRVDPADITTGKWNKKQFVKFLTVFGLKSILQDLDKYEALIVKLIQYKVKSYLAV